MRIRQTLVLLAAVGAALAVPTAAVAQEYPAPPAQVTVSDTTVAPGAAVVFSADGGFIPGEEIVISVSYGASESAAGMAGAAQSDMGSTMTTAAAASAQQGMTTQTTANASGGFSVELTLTQAGTATLTATGLQSGVTVTQTVAVSSAYAEEEAGDGALPTTGGSGLALALQVGGAATVLFIGGMMLWLSTDRRRRNSVKA